MSLRTSYLDASAIAKLVLDEAESDALRSFMRSRGSSATSVLSTVEVQRSILRRQGEPTPGVTGIFDGIALVALHAGIAARAGALLPPLLRSLDAIHLASALELLPELDAFVTYDRRLADAARAAGLPVASPGADG